MAIGVFKAHVETVVEAAHSNGPIGHKCHEMHGHSWRLEVEWVYDIRDLNEYGWGPDFGAVKDILKDLDHRNLNEHFLAQFAPSAENIAVFLHGAIARRWPQMRDLVIIVSEGGGNRIGYTEQEVS